MGMCKGGGMVVVGGGGRGGEGLQQDKWMLT